VLPLLYFGWASVNLLQQAQMFSGKTSKTHNNHGNYYYYYYYYTRLTASFPGHGYQKGKTSLDLNEARKGGVLGWHWHQLDHLHLAPDR